MRNQSTFGILTPQAASQNIIYKTMESKETKNSSKQFEQKINSEFQFYSKKVGKLEKDIKSIAKRFEHIVEKMELIQSLLGQTKSKKIIEESSSDSDSDSKTPQKRNK